MKIIFATLLHIDEKNFGSSNFKNKGIVNYINLIKNLKNSLKSKTNQDLVIVSNKPEIINKLWGDNFPPQIISYTPEIEFSSELRFLGAHYKIDALKAGLKFIKTNKYSHFCLLDCDIWCNKTLSLDQEKIFEEGDLLVFDISDQIYRSNLRQRVRQDIEYSSGKKLNEYRWYGGEFISGNEKGLSHLINVLNLTALNYIKNSQKMNHQGDENFFSASISLLKQDNIIKIIDIAPFQIITRHWAQISNRPNSYEKECAFIHAPGSKIVLEFLSRYPIIDKYGFFLLGFWRFLVTAKNILTLALRMQKK